MKLKSLKINNFHCYEDEFISFEDMNCCLIEGIKDDNDRKSNGAGKSSIFSAISWCLFGKSYSGKNLSVDSVVKIGATSCLVELQFEHGDSVYRVERTRDISSSKTTLKFEVLNEESFDKHIDSVKINEVSKDIEETIGMTYDTFINSVYFKPGEISAFATMTPSERIDVVKSLLGISNYDKCAAKARQYLKDANIKKEAYYDLVKDPQELTKELNELKFKLKDLSATRDSTISKKRGFEDALREIKKDSNGDVDLKQLKDMESKVASSESRCSLIQDRVSALTRRMAAHKNNVEEYKNTHSALKNEYLELSDLVDDTNYDKLISPLANRLSELRDNSVEINSMVSERNNQISEMTTNLHDIEEVGGSCSLCHRDISADEKDEVCGKFKAKISSLSKEVSDLGDRLSSINNEADKIKLDIGGFESSRSRQELVNRKIEEVKRKLISIKNLSIKESASYEDSKKDLEGLEEDLLEEKNKLSEVRSKYDTLKELFDPNDNSVDLENSIMEADEVIKKCDVEMGVCSANIESIKKTIKNNEELISKISEVKLSGSNYKIVADMFSKSGIQSEIVSAACGEVEEIINKYLSSVSDSEMSVEIAVDAGKFNINVIHDGISKQIEQLSDGERVRIAFTVRLALSMLLNSRANNFGVEFILLDEAVQNLDEDGRQRFAEELIRLSNKLGVKIMIISHLPDMRNFFDERLLVKKRGHTSTIEYPA